LEPTFCYLTPSNLLSRSLLSHHPFLSAYARSSLPKANGPRSRRQQEPVMVHRIAGFAWGSLLSLCVAATAFAEAPGHPRVAQINQRVAIQQSRITTGVTHGQIGPSQARRDVAVDARINRQLRRDEALNRELDRNSIRINDQRN
jgi:hypothetical protein